MRPPGLPSGGRPVPAAPARRSLERTRGQAVEERRMASDAKGARRLETGIPGLDVVLHGGLLEGGVYLVLGEPGTGKTVLASQLCAYRAASAGEHAVFTTVLTESHSRMLANLRSFAFFDEALLSRQVTFL